VSLLGVLIVTPESHLVPKELIARLAQITLEAKDIISILRGQLFFTQSSYTSTRHVYDDWVKNS